MVETVSSRQAHEWLASGEALLIDVREPDEFKAEHIAFGLSIPLSRFEQDFAALQIPESTKVLIHCLKGKRGEKACMLLHDISAQKNAIFNIEGGIDGWKEAGLPIISSAQGSGLSIFRQVQIIVGGLILAFILLGMAGFAFAFMLAALFSGALFFAGITGWCGLAMVLSKMRWHHS